jgi:hypothetical protein
LEVSKLQNYLGGATLLKIHRSQNNYLFKYFSYLWQTHTLHTFAAGVDQLIFVIKANLIMEEISAVARECRKLKAIGEHTHTASLSLMIMA